MPNSLEAAWREKFQTNGNRGSLQCDFEGVDGRPAECPNNPIRDALSEQPKKIYSPQICNQCPESNRIWETSRLDIPRIYAQFKQGDQLPVLRSQPVRIPEPSKLQPAGVLMQKGA